MYFDATTGRHGGRRRRRRGGPSFGMLEHGVDQVRMHLEHEVTQDAFVDFPLPIERRQHRAGATEIDQPIGALALAVDCVRQAAFFPQAG